MSIVTIYDHPLIQHKISVLRSVDTGNKEFRELVKEITMLICYESMRDLPLKEVEVQTSITTTKTYVIDGPKLAIVPILRAGLGMVDGVISLVPEARIGHIGLNRDHVTLEPHEYYCKLPENIAKRQIIVLDPMLATGGSAVAAINSIKARGGKNIKFMCLIAAPQGIETLQKAHLDVNIYCAQKDEKLNENGYIVPGLGDAGDRTFGTK